VGRTLPRILNIQGFHLYRCDSFFAYQTTGQAPDVWRYDALHPVIPRHLHWDLVLPYFAFASTSSDNCPCPCRASRRDAYIPSPTSTLPPSGGTRASGAFEQTRHVTFASLRLSASVSLRYLRLPRSRRPSSSGPVTCRPTLHAPAAVHTIGTDLFVRRVRWYLLTLRTHNLRTLVRHAPYDTTEERALSAGRATHAAILRQASGRLLFWIPRPRTSIVYCCAEILGGTARYRRTRPLARSRCVRGAETITHLSFCLPT